MKRTVVIGVVVAMLFFCGCAGEGGAKETGNKGVEHVMDPIVDPGEPTLATEEWTPPVSDVEDLSAAYSDISGVSFSDDAEKYTLGCVELPRDAIAESEDIITVSSSDKTRFIFHCTWGSPSREVFVGFKSCDTGLVYAVSAVGGFLTGTVDLSALPEGDYRAVLYSNDNPAVVAVMLYQLADS